MENMDNTTAMQQEPSLQEYDDEELMMQHVIGDDHELMYLHVCLSELLCPQEENA